MAREEANLAKNMLDKTQVHEVVLAGALEPPLHHAEQLLDATLRWGSWLDNYLLLKTNQFCLVLFRPSRFLLRCSSRTTIS